MSGASSSNQGAQLDLGVVSKDVLFACQDPTFSYFTNDAIRVLQRHTNFQIADVDMAYENTQTLLNQNWQRQRLRTQQRLIIPGDLLIGCVLNFDVTRLSVVADLLQPIGGGGNILNFEENLYLLWAEELAHALVAEVVFKTRGQPVEALHDIQLHDIHETRSMTDRLLVEPLGRLRSTGSVQESFTNTSLGGGRLFACIDRQLHVPVPFSFARGTPFPLDAAQKAELSFEVTLRGRSSLINAYYDSNSATNNYFSLNPDTQVLGGQMTSANITFRTVYLGANEQAFYTNNKQIRYYEFIQPFNAQPVVAGDTMSSSRIALQHGITELCAAYRSNEALSALSRTYYLNFITRPVGSGSSTVPRLEYFNFSTPILGTLLPAQVDSTGAAIVPAPSTFGFYQNPIQQLMYFVQGQIVRSDRNGTWAGEIDTHNGDKLRIEPNNYICRCSFNRDPLRQDVSSGASYPGASNTTEVRIIFAKNNVGETGISESGQVFIWARTMNYYDLDGQQMGLQWPANTLVEYNP